MGRKVFFCEQLALAGPALDVVGTREEYEQHTYSTDSAFFTRVGGRLVIGLRAPSGSEL